VPLKRRRRSSQARYRCRRILLSGGHIAFCLLLPDCSCFVTTLLLLVISQVLASDDKKKKIYDGSLNAEEWEIEEGH